MKRSTSPANMVKHDTQVQQTRVILSLCRLLIGSLEPGYAPLRRYTCRGAALRPILPHKTAFGPFYRIKQPEEGNATDSSACFMR